MYTVNATHAPITIHAPASRLRSRPPSPDGFGEASGEPAPAAPLRVAMLAVVVVMMTLAVMMVIVVVVMMMMVLVRNPWILAEDQ